MKRQLQSNKCFRSRKQKRVLESGSVHEQHPSIHNYPNIVQLLLSRSLGDVDKFKRASVFMRYSKFKLKNEYDLKEYSNLEMVNRAEVREILTPSPSLFVATLSNGKCLIFNKITNKYIGRLDEGIDCRILSLFYNKVQNHIVYIGLFGSGNRTYMRCLAIPVSDLEAGRLSISIHLFSNENLTGNSFVEFDGMNEIIITFSEHDCMYKLWSLEAYNALFAFKGENVQSLKTCAGRIILVYEPKEGKIPIKVVDIARKELIFNFRVSLAKDDVTDLFVEMFNNLVLFKQRDCDLRVIDVTKLTERRSKNLSTLPSCFVSLWKRKKLLAFFDRRVCLLDYLGNTSLTFEETFVTHSPCNPHYFYTTKWEEVLITSCIIPLKQQRQAIHFSCITSGRLISKIESAKLGKICSITMDERTNELLVGNSEGKVSIWTNE